MTPYDTFDWLDWLSNLIEVLYWLIIKVIQPFLV